MTENQFREILSRLTCFFPHSEDDMFTEYLPLKAEISVTKEPVAWEDGQGAPRLGRQVRGHAP